MEQKKRQREEKEEDWSPSNRIIIERLFIGNEYNGSISNTFVRMKRILGRRSRSRVRESGGKPIGRGKRDKRNLNGRLYPIKKYDDDKEDSINLRRLFLQARGWN